MTPLAATAVPEDPPPHGGLHAVPAAQAETEAEQNTRPDGAVPVRLGAADGVDVWVPDRRQWRNSALSALHAGDFQRWADSCLTEQDAEAWEDYDPTLEEIEEFFGARLPAAMGEDPGKQGRSRRGSSGTRRR